MDRYLNKVIDINGFLHIDPDGRLVRPVSGYGKISVLDALLQMRAMKYELDRYTEALASLEDRVEKALRDTQAG